ncbi:MAG: hypothetical protein L6416_12440 [Candidatus Omnitrophica bacterium]|nr:hypothetical protein [Candidatus Omnitrophota bacterium]
MVIKEIIEKCKKFEIYQLRTVSDNYAEIVMYTSEISKWSAIFNEILGAPVSPAGINPTAEDTQITREYGGIFAEQTLYKKDFPENTIIAMFWPWQDGERVTLKVVLLPK